MSQRLFFGIVVKEKEEKKVGTIEMKLQDIKTLITSGVIILAVGLYLIFKPEGSVLDVLNDTAPDPQEVIENTKVNQVVTLADAEQAIGKKAQSVEFISANDGDTFNVNVDGTKERIRLLMIDTPEMNYNKGEPMPYAEEAKNFTTEVMEQAEHIQLLFDKGPETDNYDRLLAYVFVDGVLLQELLLQEGYATVRYINKPNNTLEKELRDIQVDAEDKGINVWSLDGYINNNRFNENYVK
ncbi:MAG: thermonuclease family protein [Lysinibacillus sp.]